MSWLLVLLAGFASAFAFAGAIANGTQGDDDDHQLTSVDLLTSADLLTSVDLFGAPTTIHPPPPTTTAHNEGIVFGDEKVCNRPADIVFVLDESSSIYPPDFTKQLDFVQKTIESFDIGFNRTHVGVLTFANTERVIFPLGKYTDKAELKNAVKEINQMRGDTFTHLALKRLREDMFSRQYTRSWVPHIAIVITDGESNYRKKTVKEAKLCHQEDIQVFAIGVGTAVVKTELEAIASRPDMVFSVESYAALEKLRLILAAKACGSWISSVTTSTFSSSESVSTTLDAVESTTSEGPGQQSPTNWYLIALSLVAAFSLLLVIIGVLVVAFCIRLKKKRSAKYASTVSGNLEMPMRDGDYEILPYATSDTYEMIDDASAVLGKLEMPIRDGDYDIQPYATSENYETIHEAAIEVFFAPRQGPLPTPGYSGLTKREPTAPTVYTSSIDTYETPVDITPGSIDMEVLAIVETTSERQVDDSEDKKDGEGKGNQSTVHPYIELFDVVVGENPEEFKSTSDFDIPSSYLTVNF